MPSDPASICAVNIHPRDSEDAPSLQEHLRMQTGQARENYRKASRLGPDAAVQADDAGLVDMGGANELVVYVCCSASNNTHLSKSLPAPCLPATRLQNLQIRHRKGADSVERSSAP